MEPSPDQEPPPELDLRKALAAYRQGKEQLAAGQLTEQERQGLESLRAQLARAYQAILAGQRVVTPEQQQELEELLRRAEQPEA